MALLLRATRAAARLSPQARLCAPSARLLSTSYPADRKYKSSHEWVKPDGSGNARVGITQHAQASLGEIVFADLPDVGMEVAAAENTAALESVKAAAEIYAPVAGEVVAVNTKLEDTPELINKMPHEDGWVFELKLADPAELDGLMDSAAYEASLDDEAA